MTMTQQSRPQRGETTCPHERQDGHPQVNVGRTERLVNLAGGGMLGWVGIRRGTLGGLALAGLGALMIRRGWTGHCPAYLALGIDTAHQGAAAGEEYFDHGIQVLDTTTVNKPAEELYRFWRNFENLPRFMNNVESVRVRDDRRSHWVVKAPAGRTVQWDAKIINDEPDSRIAWRSLDGADVDNAGSVTFIPGLPGRGTEVRVNIQYIPPAGRLGALVARLFGRNPQQQVREDLRRFKQLMERGEIPTTEGQLQRPCAR